MRRATAADGGDWVCGDAGCANVNFARRPTCNRCGRRKPRQAASPAAGAEIGKSAADKSRGLFSADDWQCGKCANVNWARRQTCNVCNAPRFGEVRGERRRRSRAEGERRRLRSEGRESSGDPKRTLSIMENRVTSTNDVKYVFKGKTPEEDLEVTYSLRERVQVAAWAIVHRSCETSATEFQSYFDKPAPDFKTIFAWRQRLLDTGCLVDGHSAPSEIGNGAKRRRRPRYFRPVYRSIPRSDTEDSTRDKSDDESDCIIDEKNNTNGSVTRSSPSLKRSAPEIDITDDARSATPDISSLRVELAQHRSPPTGMDYFEEEPKTAEPIVDIPHFREPEPPKPLKKKSVDDSIDNMLEDIVSESERYSSDPGSENDSVPQKKPSRKRVCRVSISVPDDSTDADFPIQNFIRRKSASEENGDDRNFSSAMRRMFGSISSRNEDNEEANVEYVPTKINPEMAERNHRLFKDVRDVWPERNGSPIPAIEIEDAQVTKKVHIDDYMPDEDTLYRDDLSENKSNNEVLIPPKAPNIGSIKNDSIVEDVSIKMPSLLDFNFSSINTDDIAMALKNIHNMSLLNNSVVEKENESQIICNISSESPTKKMDNIPFLDDIFDPGSPLKERSEDEKLADENVDGELILDEVEGCGRSKRTNVLSGFKSFALPKPILFNRLRNVQQVKESRDITDEDNNDKKTKNKTKKNSASNSHKGDNQSSKKLYDDEDEESGEEGDLSKYDLWGSEEENENKHEKEKEASSPSPKESTIDAEPKKGKEPSKSPIPPATESKRQLDRSRSASSKRSSSSSSSSTTSSGKPPRNRYDDFILNSEHSRAGSRDDSSSARSRSPVYDRSRRRSRSRDKKDKSGRADRDRKSRDNRDSNKSRGRNRDRDRDRHHYGGNRSKPGSGYTRGRAR